MFEPMDEAVRTLGRPRFGLQRRGHTGTIPAHCAQSMQDRAIT